MDEIHENLEADFLENILGRLPDMYVAAMMLIIPSFIIS